VGVGSPVRLIGMGWKDWVCCAIARFIGSGFRPRATCYFLLRGQKKLTKEKAAPMSRPAGSLRYSPGAGSSDGTSVCRRKNARHPWRAPCGQFRPGLRCSARHRGFPTGSPAASRWTVCAACTRFWLWVLILTFGFSPVCRAEHRSLNRVKPAEEPPGMARRRAPIRARSTGNPQGAGFCWPRPSSGRRKSGRRSSGTLR